MLNKLTITKRSAFVFTPLSYVFIPHSMKVKVGIYPRNNAAAQNRRDFTDETYINGQHKEVPLPEIKENSMLVIATLSRCFAIIYI